MQKIMIVDDEVPMPMQVEEFLPPAPDTFLVSRVGQWGAKTHPDRSWVPGQCNKTVTAYLRKPCPLGMVRDNGL